MCFVLQKTFIPRPIHIRQQQQQPPLVRAGIRWVVACPINCIAPTIHPDSTFSPTVAMVFSPTQIRFRVLGSSSSSHTGHGQNHNRKGSCVSFLAATAAVFVLAGIVSPVDARDIKYCSNVNTSDQKEGLYDLFQSHGACYDECVKDSKNAFAIVQGAYCWCSTYIPGTTTTGCTQECPGYLADKCGNMDLDLYGYMALSGKPQGTKGAIAKTSSVSITSILTQHDVSTAPGVVTTVTTVGPTQTQTLTTVRPLYL